MSSREIYLPTQELFVQFFEKMQEANEFLEQRIVICYVIDELRNKQHLFRSSEVEKAKGFNNQHHRLLRDSAQINAVQFTFFPI